MSDGFPFEIVKVIEVLSHPLARDLFFVIGNNPDGINEDDVMSAVNADVYGDAITVDGMLYKLKKAGMINERVIIFAEEDLTTYYEISEFGYRVFDGFLKMLREIDEI